MKKIKIYIIALVLVASLVLHPTAAAVAAEPEGQYDETLPFLQGLDFELDSEMKSAKYGSYNAPGSLIFKFDKSNYIQYIDFDFVFVFELRSQLDEGINTYSHTEVLDISANDKGFFNNLLVSLNLKDDFFKFKFDYTGIVSKSPDYKVVEKELKPDLFGTSDIVERHNTVVSKIDCYLRDKESGNYGPVNRLIFTWDSKFEEQWCKAITYQVYAPDTGFVLATTSVSDYAGIYRISSNVESIDFVMGSLVANVARFIVDIPAALYSIISGISGLASAISSLFKLFFPFLPSVLFDVFGGLIVFAVALAIWRKVKS